MSAATVKERGGLPRFLKRVFRKAIRSHYLLERLIYYRNPRNYWTTRGGETYFQEQESYPSRQIRSEWIASEISALAVRSILEIGCGYGKQLRNLSHKMAVGLFGADFSHSQLLKAQQFLPPFSVPLVEADAVALPFFDNSFDLVFSSGVILHNPRSQARQILAEMIRTSRGYLVHNEDKNVSSTRFGYDLAAFYGRLGFKIIKWSHAHGADNPKKTQFLIVHFTPAQREHLNPETMRAAFQFAEARC